MMRKGNLTCSRRLETSAVRSIRFSPVRNRMFPPQPSPPEKKGAKRATINLRQHAQQEHDGVSTRVNKKEKKDIYFRVNTQETLTTVKRQQTASAGAGALRPFFSTNALLGTPVVLTTAYKRHRPIPNVQPVKKSAQGDSYRNIKSPVILPGYPRTSWLACLRSSTSRTHISGRFTDHVDDELMMDKKRDGERQRTSSGYFPSASAMHR